MAAESENAFLNEITTLEYSIYPPPPLEDIAHGNQQVNHNPFAPQRQDINYTPNGPEDGGICVQPPAADDHTFDTTTTESLTGGSAVGHRVPGGASAAGKRPAEASNSPDAKKSKIADTSSLCGFDLEIPRVKSDPTVKQIKYCATFLSKLLRRKLAPREVFDWCLNYGDNEGREPIDTGSPDGLLLMIISLHPKLCCEEMQTWVEFILSWSGKLFTLEHVSKRWLDYWLGSKDSMAGEGLPPAEDGTTASNSLDSAYGTGPPPPDATQLRGPELPIPTPSKVFPRLPVKCPFIGCAVPVKNPSGWKKHKTVHWPTKYGCPFCYERNGACKRCGLSLQPLDYCSVAKHVIICVQKDKDEVERISRRGAGWWQWQHVERLRSHLAKEHSTRASEKFSDTILATCKVEIPQSHTTCLNCDISFPSAQELDEHYGFEHFRTEHGKNPRDNSGGGDDDHSDNNDNSDNDNDAGAGAGAGAGSSNQNRHSSQQNGTRGGSTRNTHRSPTAGTSTTAGQQRSAGMQETRGGRDDVHMRDIIASHNSNSAYGSLTLLNEHLALDRHSTLHSGAYLWGMGSQFVEKPKGRPGAEGDETQQWVRAPYRTTKSPSKVVDLCQRLGKGSTATVDSVWYPNSNEELARKSIRLGQAASDHCLVAQIRREIKTLTMLRHRHIISLVDWYETPQSMELLMSPVAKENLMGFLNTAAQPGKHVSELVARSPSMIDQVAGWMSCLSSALAYMHSRGVTHGDIKPHNVLIRGRQVWFGDFGTAEFETASATGPGFSSRWLTPVYSAPEAGNDGPRGRSDDIWSFGCLLLEVSTWMAGYQIQSLREFRGSAKSQPYHINFDSTMSWIEKLRRSFKLQKELLKREYILDALCAMLLLNPDVRITGLEVWKRLAGRGCKEGGCPCDNEPPQVVNERLQEDLQSRPSGTLQTPEETENEVIDAMKEVHGKGTAEDDLVLGDDACGAQSAGGDRSPWLQSLYSAVGTEWIEQVHPQQRRVLDQHTTPVENSTSAEQVDDDTNVCGPSSTAVSEWAATPDVKEYLGTSPVALRETHERIFNDIGDQAGSAHVLRGRALRQVLRSVIPLTGLELVAAICSSSGDLMPNDPDLDTEFVTKTCRNLVVGMGSAWRSAHLSAQEYLKGHDWPNKSHVQLLGAVCLRLLMSSEDIFSAATSRHDATDYWHKHLTDYDPASQEATSVTGHLLSESLGDPTDSSHCYSRRYDSKVWYGYCRDLPPEWAAFAAVTLGLLPTVARQTQDGIVDPNLSLPHVRLLLAMCSLLFGVGADVNSSTVGLGTPLLRAFSDRRLSSIELLVEKPGIHADKGRGNSGAAALCNATAMGNSRLVQLLLDAGANPNLMEKGNESTTRLYKGFTPALHVSASQCDIDVVRTLIQRGADVNLVTGRYQTPFMSAFAAHKQHKAVVEDSIQDGADFSLSRALSPCLDLSGERNNDIATAVLGGGVLDYVFNIPRPQGPKLDQIYGTVYVDGLDECFARTEKKRKKRGFMRVLDALAFRRVPGDERAGSERGRDETETASTPTAGPRGTSKVWNQRFRRGSMVHRW